MMKCQPKHSGVVVIITNLQNEVFLYWQHATLQFRESMPKGRCGSSQAAEASRMPSVYLKSKVLRFYTLVFKMQLYWLHCWVLDLWCTLWHFWPKQFSILEIRKLRFSKLVSQLRSCSRTRDPNLIFMMLNNYFHCEERSLGTLKHTHTHPTKIIASACISLSMKHY